MLWDSTKSWRFLTSCGPCLRIHSQSDILNIFQPVNGHSRISSAKACLMFSVNAPWEFSPEVRLWGFVTLGHASHLLDEFSGLIHIKSSPVTFPISHVDPTDCVILWYLTCFSLVFRIFTRSHLFVPFAFSFFHIKVE